MEREYVVVVKNGINISEVDAQMAAAAGDATIPSRPCECADPLERSDRMTHWMLTDEEAEALRNDERVLDIEIPLKDRTDISVRPNARQNQIFDKTATASGVNWGLSRCSSATNNFGDGIETVTENYMYALDGTGIDVVVMDSGIELDHPEFQDLNGVSRIKQIDWFAESAGAVSGTQSASHYTDTDGHGTFCAGVAAGKTYGWAKNADIYVSKIFDTGKLSVLDALDTLLAWHNNKGTGRPTVVNMSFGYYYDADVGAKAGDTGSYYNSSTGNMDAWTFGDVGFATAAEVSYRVNVSYITNMSLRLSQIDARIDSLVAAGVHVIIAAGNNFDVQYNDTTTTNDGYNDYILRASANLGNPCYYHRGASPRTTDNGDDVVVGNISSALRSSLEQTSNSSGRGPAIDIWAPGTHITSSISSSHDFVTSGTYPEDANYKIGNSTGTSFSAPQAAGLAAMYLQLFPTLTPAQLKEKMISESKTGLLYDLSESQYNAVDKYQYIFSGGLFGSSTNMLYNRFHGDVLVRRGY
jgi:subtilisin family serine protease|tara:strand:+ start:634 stop:2211 length:1578 start_codon:yes stop_codon:yes gene_type:complete